MSQATGEPPALLLVILKHLDLKCASRHPLLCVPADSRLITFVSSPVALYPPTAHRRSLGDEDSLALRHSAGLLESSSRQCGSRVRAADESHLQVGTPVHAAALWLVVRWTLVWFSQSSRCQPGRLCSPPSRTVHNLACSGSLPPSGRWMSEPSTSFSSLRSALMPTNGALHSDASSLLKLFPF